MFIYEIENIPSISTGEFFGKLETPIATLLCFPFIPNTFYNKI